MVGRSVEVGGGCWSSQDLEERKTSRDKWNPKSLSMWALFEMLRLFFCSGWDVTWVSSPAHHTTAVWKSSKHMELILLALKANTIPEATKQGYVSCHTRMAVKTISATSKASWDSFFPSATNPAASIVELKLRPWCKPTVTGLIISATWEPTTPLSWRSDVSSLCQ